LLARYRNYLGLLVRLQVRSRPRLRRDIERILEEVAQEIARKTSLFRGSSERDFLRWVRRVIGQVLANSVHHDSGTKYRDRRLERALVEELDQSSLAMTESFVASPSSPSETEPERNQAVLLADALHELPEDHREVIILRQLEGLCFPDVASLLGQTEESVKSVWVRALARLRFTLEGLR
jgi:RNA polymerase sigma-70 factor (ECF subfamily)